MSAALVVALLLGASARLAWSTHVFMASAVREHGEVIGFVAGSALVRFKPEGDDPHRVLSTVSSEPPQFHEGDKVAVLYPAGRPNEARIDTFAEIWSGPLILAAIGAVVGMLAAAWSGALARLTRYRGDRAA